MADTNTTIQALKKFAFETDLDFWELGKHVRELTGKNDRLIGVVCGAVVELKLRELLQAAMPNGPGGLFDPSAPLGTFSAKIEVAYRFGLIAPQTRRNADYIRYIRNAFAHRIGPISFKTKQVADACKLLVVTGSGANRKDVETDMRARYTAAAISTAGEIIKNRPPPNGQPGGWLQLRLQPPIQDSPSTHPGRKKV